MFETSEAVQVCHYYCLGTDSPDNSVLCRLEFEVFQILGAKFMALLLIRIK